MTSTAAPSSTDSGARTTRAWLPVAAVAVTLLLWASAFVAIRHLRDDFSAGPLSLGRLLVGSLCLGAVALRRGVPRPTGAQWVRLLTIGVLWYGVYNVALNEGETRVDAGTASMLIQSSPVLIALLAAAFLGERFTVALGLGLALAFGGVALIGLATGDGSGGSDVLGVLLCLVSAAAYSVSVVVQKPLSGTLPPVQITWLTCTIGAVVCLPFLPSLVGEVGDAPASSVLWVVYLGVFPTAIAFTTYAYALGHMSASSLGVTTYLVPPLTIVLGWAFLGETPPAMAYAGGALALLGVAVTRRAPKAVSSPAASAPSPPPARP